ncbi:MAG: SOS response-associated peptidase [Phycisphaerales bacterium]|nr:SOS response-associated peptidase [Phycisphaerales bacterium]
MSAKPGAILMCGRFTLTNPKGLAACESWIAPLEPDLEPLLIPRYNIAPGQRVLILRKNGTARWTGATWGFKLTEGAAPQPHILINARMETVSSRRTFAQSFEHGRCIIPADGFYEWPKEPHKLRRGPRDKMPQWFALAEQQIFGLAGLFRRGSHADDDSAECVVLTRPADDVVGAIHDRMPVIIPREQWQAYLTASKAAATDLLETPTTAKLCSKPVSQRINSVKNDDPACLLDRGEFPPQMLF